MDLIDLITTKGFLGQEFLTWLCWKADEGKVFKVGENNIVITFKGKAALSFGEGSECEKVSCSGSREMHEAMLAISLGKKFESAELQIDIGDYSFTFTLCPGLMELKSIKLPKTAGSTVDGATEEAEIEGMVLERIFLFEQLRETMEAIFITFMTVRSNILWIDEARDISRWIQERNDI